MKVLSLFDGISCGRVALERAGIPVSRYVAYEIDKYAIQVSQANYPDIEHCGSVVGADFTQYKGFDMVIGGFPCTDLSIAKANRKGLEGEHSSLFWQLVRAIDEVKPRYFLVENNASMPKVDRDIITATLGVEPILINSALVSTQQRKRLYWTNIPSIQQPEDRGLVLADVLESDGITYNSKAYCLTANYGKATAGDYLKRRKQQQVFEPVCVNAKSGRGGNPIAQPSVQDRIYQPSGKMVALTTSHRPNIAQPIRIGNVGDTVHNKQGYRVYSVRGKSCCLSANGSGVGGQTGLYKIDLPDGDYIIRKLTPVECERLQTLPDGYTACGSNTRHYKCLGLGWTVEVIVHIFKHINL